MQKIYRVTLTPEERSQLTDLISAGKAAARKLAHARILLKADESPGEPGWEDARIVEALEVSRSTVARVRERFVELGLAAALDPKKSERPTTPPKIDGAAEARLCHLACSPPPPGRVAWTLRLLADKMVELEIVDSVSHETVRKVLKKTRPNRG